MHVDELLATMASFHLRASVTDEVAVKRILDPSSVYYCQRQVYINLEAVTRDYCYTLHDKHSTLLGYTSRFTMARCKNNLLQVRQ